MATITTPTANAERDKQTRRQRDAKLLKRNRDRDLSTAPAWIGLPDLSGVDLTQTQKFPLDKKVRPRKRRWGDDWRELIVGASPYNRNVAPVPEKPTITVQEAVARNILKLRTKLGITPADLRPASVALESERNFNEASAEGVKGEEYNTGGVKPTTAPDVGRWKREVDDMLTLLGTKAEKCTSNYPLTELKRKQERQAEGHQHTGSPAKRRHPEFSTSVPSLSGGDFDDRTVRGNPPNRSNAQKDMRGRENSYPLPRYRHDAPWPRPRPSAEAAAKARARRRIRAQQGTSTAADARAELEDKVSASLVGVIPEEFCRDAPPTASAPASAFEQKKKANEGASRGQPQRMVGLLTTASSAKEKGSSSSTHTRTLSSQQPSEPSSLPSNAAGVVVVSGATAKSTRCKQQPPRSKRHHSERITGASGGGKEGSRLGEAPGDQGGALGDQGERSRRRLAAFLQARASSSEAAAAALIPSQAAGLAMKSSKPSRNTTGDGRWVRGGGVNGNGGTHGNITSSGGALESGQKFEENTSAPTSGRRNDQTFFELGGDALASTAPSRSMAANLIGILEESLGRGLWADPVASQLARPLNAILAYLPPEGARLHKESGRRFQQHPGVHNEEAEEKLVTTSPLARAGRAKSATTQRTSKALVEKQTCQSSTDTVSSSGGGGAEKRAKAGIVRGDEAVTRERTAKEAELSSSRSPSSSTLLTVTMERGSAEEVPRAVWLGRLAAVMEATGDRDGAVRLYGEASDELVGKRPRLDFVGSNTSSHSIDHYRHGKPVSTTSVNREGDLVRDRDGGGGGNGCDGGIDLFPYSARAHHLASMIERSYRRHFLRRTVAQIRVAAICRGHMVRATSRRNQYRRCSAATFLARAWRRRMRQLDLAAVGIQAVVRGALGRLKAREQRVFIRSAIVLQSTIRMVLAKKKVSMMRLQEACAALLQALQRGFALRRVRAAAISNIHSDLWRATLGLNRVARGFLHRRFAGMVRKFAVDCEIDRSEAEAAVVGAAVRLATSRVNMYLATEVGKAELAQETKRAKAAAVQSKISMRSASPEKRRRASAQDVFDSFDVDGSGTINTSELKSLLAAMGVAMTDAEVKVASARIDASGSGDIDFSEFYAWFTGTDGGTGDGGGGGDDSSFGGASMMMSDRESRSIHSRGRTPNSTFAMRGRSDGPISTTSPERNLSGKRRGLKNSARTAFVKARRRVKSVAGMTLRDRARRGVIRRWVASAAREAQVRFRETRPPPLECCVCHQAFDLYGGYWKHFGGGSLAGADLRCGRLREREGEERGERHQPYLHRHHDRDHRRWQRGRLFLDTTTAVGEELFRRRRAEQQWQRLLDERRCLEDAGTKAEAVEDARITQKGSMGEREHAALTQRLLTTITSDLRAKLPSRGDLGVPCTQEARAMIGRLAFQAFDRDGYGLLDVSELADLLEVVKRIAGKSPPTGTGTDTSTVGGGAAETGLGLEAVMNVMDGDRSGQIDVDEFMSWFDGQSNGCVVSPRSTCSSGRRQETDHPKHVEIRTNVQNAGGGDAERTGGARDDRGDEKSDEGSDSSKPELSGGGPHIPQASMPSPPSISLAGTSKVDGTPGAGGRGQRIFGWLRRSRAPAAANEGPRNEAKRKRPDDMEQELEKGGESISTSSNIGDGEEEDFFGKKRRRVGNNGREDSYLSPSSTQKSLDKSQDKSAFSSPSRLLSGLRKSGATDPLKVHRKTLGAVAAHQARTLLLRRARLRAQVKELDQFRATRPPEYDAWSQPNFVDSHSHSLSEITEVADASFVATLRRNYREAEEAVNQGMVKPPLQPPPTLPPSPSGIVTARDTIFSDVIDTPPTDDGDSPEAPATTIVTPVDSATKSDVVTSADVGTNSIVAEPMSAMTPLALDATRRGDNGEVVDDGEKVVGGPRINDLEGGVARSREPSTSRPQFGRSLRGGKWWKRGGSDAQTRPPVVGEEGYEDHISSDFVKTVKAAERDAAAARRRGFRTAAGRAEIARKVLRLKANTVIAAEAQAEAATAAAAKGSQISELLDVIERANTAGSAAASAANVAETGGSLTAEEIPSADAGGAASVFAADSAAARIKERERKTLTERAMQLFDLFDADGSGAIDREELAPLLRQLGIWVSVKMETDTFPRLDLDGSGDVRQEELMAWLENEGTAFHRSPLSRILRAGQSVQARGSSSRRLENQVRASIIARSRAIARSEAWESAPEVLLAPAPASEGARAPPGALPATSSRQQDDFKKLKQQEQGRIAAAEEEATGDLRVANSTVGTVGKKRGWAMAARAAGRRRRFEKQERETQCELLVKRAEDEAERRVKRGWRTRAGAAELQRERDRIRGASEALDLTLQAWDANVAAVGGVGNASMDPAALQRKRTEEKLRHGFRLFDMSCDGCIDAEELGRLLSRLNVPMSEPEVVVLLHKIDRDGSGDVDFAEFSAWWHEVGLKRSRRPAAVIRSALSSLAAKMAPMAAAERDARRALISSSRFEARAEVKEILRLEDEREAVLHVATKDFAEAASATDAYRAAGGTGRMLPVGQGSNAPLVSLDGVLHGGNGGNTHRSSLTAKRLTASRASKLARAEAEAYADVQATIRTNAGNRELARRARSLRLEWKAAVKDAHSIARRKRHLRVSGRRGWRTTEAHEDNPKDDFNVSAHAPEELHAANLVEVPFLQFLWGVHGCTTATTEAVGTVAGENGVGVEPSELKYLGASLRQTLAGRATRSVRGGEATTILGSTLVLGKAAHLNNTRRTSGGSVPSNAAATWRPEEGLSLSDIFDDDSDNEIRNLKTLTRVGIEDVVASLQQPALGTESNLAGGSVDSMNPISTAAASAAVLRSGSRTRTKAQGWIDLATITRLRLRLFTTPGAFRKLAKEAMLAEGRAFERHELARAIALEDSEPWRRALAAETRQPVGSADGSAPADVDRHRATAAGAAKLYRALAQGEDLAVAECRSFLKTSTGRAELRNTIAMVREQRRLKIQLAATAAATAASDARGSFMPGLKTIKRLVSVINNLGRDELRQAFVLCEADGARGEISRAEATHVLAFAGIPQTTVATAGRVRLPRQGKARHKNSRGGHQRRPTKPKRKSRRRWRPWSAWRRKPSTGERRKSQSEGEPSKSVLQERKYPLRTLGGISGRGFLIKDKSSNRSHTKVCPTNSGDHEDDGKVDSVVPTTESGGEDQGSSGNDDRNGRGGGVVRKCEQDEDKFTASTEEDVHKGVPDDDIDIASACESDQNSEGDFSVDMGIVDDVTSDEGFELGEMEILLAVAKARQTLSARMVSMGWLLGRRALPTHFADRRDARMLLLSRARGAGRERALANFENLLKVESQDNGGVIST